MLILLKLKRTERRIGISQSSIWRGQCQPYDPGVILRNVYNTTAFNFATMIFASNNPAATTLGNLFQLLLVFLNYSSILTW